MEVKDIKDIIKTTRITPKDWAPPIDTKLPADPDAEHIDALLSEGLKNEWLDCVIITNMSIVIRGKPESEQELRKFFEGMNTFRDRRIRLVFPG